MRVDAYASLPHYAEHVAPVWAALPEAARGRWWAPPGRPWGEAITARRDPGRLVLVASLADARRIEPNPLAYLEHGAGQTYAGHEHNGSYSGGADRALERVRLFLCPSETVAARWRARYPASAAVVGCPKLDAWHDGERSSTSRVASHAGPPHSVGSGQGPPAGAAGPTVAVTFHWDCGVVPETRSAWPHYDPELGRLVGDAAERGWRLLGHGHPRLWGAISRRWRQLRVEPAPDLATVLDRADVLVGDNTSALYEFASLGRPVLVLNAPWYRRHVEHGLRFWSAVPGVQIDQPHHLTRGVEWALADEPAAAALRARAVSAVYAATDGAAARRAADAIVEVLA